MGFLNRWKPLWMSLYLPTTAAEAATVKATRTCVTAHSLHLEPPRSSGAYLFHHKTKETHVLVWKKGKSLLILVVSLALNKPKTKAGYMRSTNKSCIGVGQSGLCFLVLLTYLTLRCHCPSHRKVLDPACP